MMSLCVQTMILCTAKMALSAERSRMSLIWPSNLLVSFSWNAELIVN